MTTEHEKNHNEAASTAFKPWAESIEHVCSHLATSEQGLSASEADQRLRPYGHNAFKRKESTSLAAIFLKQFASPLIFLLLGAAAVSYTLGDTLDTFVIVGAVMFNVVLGFYREHHAENTLDKLVTYIKDRARVIRDGKETEIDSSLLVPGDVIRLSYGSRVPADARLMRVSDLRVDETVLTGESIPLEKETGEVSLASVVADRKNIAHAGTLVVEGYATAVVYATGETTEIGKIAGIVAGTSRAETPIQTSMKKLAWIIFFLTIVIVGGIFVLGTMRGEPFLEMLALSAAIAVGAVPEALPIALTVILAIGAERIASKKGIVRKLAAAETLGSTTLIMTDKTGTLTMADMSLVGVYTSEQMIDNARDSRVNFAPNRIDEDSGARHFSIDQRRLLLAALNNIDVTIENPDAKAEEWTLHGKPFEINMAKECIKHGIGIENLKEERRMVIPFNSTHKFSVSETDDEYIVMGAPDILLRRARMEKDAYISIESWIDAASSEGMRLIGLARIKKHASDLDGRSKSGRGKKISVEDIQKIDFLGVAALHDPIRADVPRAIKRIEGFGIKMVMITGDLKGTALAVSRDLGWKVTEEEVLTGSEMHSMTDEELLEIIPRMKIYARVTPEDKLRIGQLYRKLGEVIAMTGDGVNDAPALKAMDIGISLGSGSDVAKSAADMVLLDDNFKTIALSVEEGRKILANIRKTFVFLMSNSLDAIFVIGGSLMLGLPIPLTPLQIIWANFFTGSMPTLAFAFDEDLDAKHEGSRSRKKMKNKDLQSVGNSKSILTNEVIFITFGIGTASSLMIFVLYLGLVRFGIPTELAQSILFVCFASYILAIAYSFRSMRSPLFSYPAFSNKKLNASVVLAALFLIASFTVPTLREALGLVTIPLVWIPFFAGWLIVNIAMVEAAKWILRKS